MLEERKTECCVINSHSLTHTITTGAQEGIHWDPPSLEIKSSISHWIFVHVNPTCLWRPWSLRRWEHDLPEWTTGGSYHNTACENEGTAKKLPKYTSTRAKVEQHCRGHNLNIRLNIDVNLRMTACYKKEQLSWVEIFMLGQTCYSTIYLIFIIFFLTERKILPECWILLLEEFLDCLELIIECQSNTQPIHLTKEGMENRKRLHRIVSSI